MMQAHQFAGAQHSSTASFTDSTVCRIHTRWAGAPLAGPREAELIREARPWLPQAALVLRDDAPQRDAVDRVVLGRAADGELTHALTRGGVPMRAPRSGADVNAQLSVCRLPFWVSPIGGEEGFRKMGVPCALLTCIALPMLRRTQLKS